MSNPQPQSSPEDVLRRIAELRNETDAPVKEQHVVSEVLLKGFARGDRGAGSGPRLMRFDFRYPDNVLKPVPVDRCGRITDFVQFASGSVEKVWGETESKLPFAMKAIADKVIHKEPELEGVVRDCLALHYARSIPARIVHYRVWLDGFGPLKSELLEDRHFLSWAFHERYGLYPSGSEDLSHIFDDLFGSTLASVKNGEFFRVRAEHLFRQAKARLADIPLEIGVADKDDLLIGDAPLITLRRGHPGIGILGGVPIAEATALHMPLSRRYVAGLGQKADYIPLSREHVIELNRKQVQAAQFQVHFHPEVDLGPFIKSVRADGAGEIDRSPSDPN